MARSQTKGGEMKNYKPTFEQSLNKASIAIHNWGVTLRKYIKLQNKTLSEAWDDLKQVVFKELKIKQICD